MTKVHKSKQSKSTDAIAASVEKLYSGLIFKFLKIWKLELELSNTQPVYSDI